MSASLQLFSGAVKIYTKSYTGSDNDPMSVENTVDWTNWDLLEWKKQSNEQPVITIESEVEDVNVVGHGPVLERALVGESCKIATMLKAATLATLEFSVFGGTYTAAAVAGTNPNEFSVGDVGTVPVWSIGIEGVNADGNAVVVFAQRTTASQSAEFVWKKGDNEIPFEFDCLVDEDATAGKSMIRIREITTASKKN